MKKLFAGAALAAVIVLPSAGRTEDITRFTPLKTEELTPPQKAWADMIAAPPRNAKFTAPPYRAYIRNPDLAPKLSALSEYLRWNTSLAPRLSELAILITARDGPRNMSGSRITRSRSRAGSIPRWRRRSRRASVPTA